MTEILRHFRILIGRTRTFKKADAHWTASNGNPVSVSSGRLTNGVDAAFLGRRDFHQWRTWHNGSEGLA